MKSSVLGLAAILSVVSFSQVGAQTRPSDVRAGHWAEKAVTQALDNRLLAMEGGKFKGEGQVTQTQGVNALAALAKMLEKGMWKRQNSTIVPAQSDKVADTANWEKQTVSRFTLAIVLTKFGNYFVNGAERQDKGGSKEVGKSEAFPPKPTIAVPKSHPAYTSLAYLADKHMIFPGSPLLKPDNRPLKADELSHALMEVALGLNNQVTELGLDKDSGTPDKTFHKKKTP